MRFKILKDENGKKSVVLMHVPEGWVVKGSSYDGIVTGMRTCQFISEPDNKTFIANVLARANDALKEDFKAADSREFIEILIDIGLVQRLQ